jgi:hypothetical protein
MEAKVKHYQELFGLQNWNIEIKKDATLNGNARTIADPRYCKAVITFRFDSDPANEDAIIIHELIHIIMAAYDYLVDNNKEISKIDQSAADELFFNARESSVSQLTQVIMRILKHDNQTTESV